MYNGTHLHLLDLLIMAARVEGFNPTLMLSENGEIYKYKEPRFCNQILVREILRRCKCPERTNPAYRSLYEAVEQSVPH
jgi:hypothetical protein